MDILESIFALIQKNFLDIITVLWIIWFAGVGVGGRRLHRLQLSKPADLGQAQPEI